MKNFRRSRRSAARAFTLIEVLLVLVILVVLGSFAVGMFTNTQKKANIQAAQAQVNSFKTPINQYHLELNQYPTSLESLISAPSDLANPAKWNGPYIDSNTVPVDPWGNPYQYAAPGTHNPHGFDVWSLGPDAANGTQDDIGNWQAT